MRPLILALALLPALAWPMASPFAFTALAVASDRAYGYCFDMGSYDEAEGCAVGFCMQNSSDPGSCAIYMSSGDLAYYAVAVGSKGWGWGYNTQDESIAQSEALYQCQVYSDDCEIRASWIESQGDN